MPAPVNEEYEAQAAETDEYVEVQGGNYAPVWDFDENPQLDAAYVGHEKKNIKGDDKIIHTFLRNPVRNADGVWEGDEVQAWGAAVLNSRLDGLEGAKVRVIKTGEKLTSASGRNPWEFKVFVAKSAFAG